MPTRKDKKSQAGQAIQTILDRDPEAQKSLANLRLLSAALREVAAPLEELMPKFDQVFAHLSRHLDPEFRDLEAMRQQSFSKLADELYEALAAAKSDLAAKGFETALESQEGWEHLARMVEKDPTQMTINEIYHWALAWVDRERMRLKLSTTDGSPSRVPEQSEHEGDEGISQDEHDLRFAWYMGKRIYLGDDTQISRLFWLLAKPLGCARHLSEVQQAVDGFETAADSDPERALANQRLRKAMAKLRARLREADLDMHLLIHRAGSNEDPEWTMLRRFGRRR